MSSGTRRGREGKNLDKVENLLGATGFFRDSSSTSERIGKDSGAPQFFRVFQRQPAGHAGHHNDHDHEH